VGLASAFEDGPGDRDDAGGERDRDQGAPPAAEKRGRRHRDLLGDHEDQQRHAQGVAQAHEERGQGAREDHVADQLRLAQAKALARLDQARVHAADA
jgi:hypothetical protein